MRPNPGAPRDPNEVPPFLLLLWKLYVFPLSLAYTINIFLVNRLPEKWALLPDTFYIRCLTGIIFGKGRILRLREIYPKKSPKKIAELSEANVHYRIRFNAQVSRSLSTPLEDYEKQHSLHGEEHLQAAVQEGRGVLLLQAHYGNFYAPNCLLPRKGYDLTVIGIPLIPPPFETLTQTVLSRFGCTRIISGQGGGKTAVKVFRRQGILCAFFDVVPPGKKGPEVLSLPFGKSVIGIYDGPARLASKFNVTVVPVISYFTGPFRSETYVEPAFPVVKGESEEETIQLMNKQWVDWFEPKLMARPDQWWSWPFVTLPEMKK